MTSVPGPPAGVTAPPVYVDGFGARYHTFDPEAGEPDNAVEVLCFNQSLVDAPEFASTLGVRVARLGSVRHTLFARVRRLDRPAEDSLVLVSDRIVGWRLAHVLDVMEREDLSFDISAVLSLVRQLIPTVSLFARHQRELAVGTIGPEHLILMPTGRLVLCEYVLGAAIETLGLSREELWRTYRVAATPGATKIWTRSDALSIGIVVLSLLCGRRLRDDEFPEGIAGLLQNAEESSGGMVRPLSPKLSAWLGRALQLDSRTAFQSPQDAQVAFEEMLASERGYVTTPALLDAFITRFKALTELPPPPAPVPEQCAPGLTVDAEVPAPAPAVEKPVAFTTPPPAAQPEPEPEPVAVALPPAPPVATEGVRVRFARAVAPRSALVVAALAIAILLEAVIIFWLWNDPTATAARTGELVVRTQPAGATVAIDDKELGTTPVTVRLAPGTYTLKVKLGTSERSYPVQIRAGTQSVQYLELQPSR
jgi:hypothetical protein